MSDTDGQLREVVAGWLRKWDADEGCDPFVMFASFRAALAASPSTASGDRPAQSGPTRSNGERDTAGKVPAVAAPPSRLLMAEPCARYWGSDGTLCATHNGRFLSPSETRCDRNMRLPSTPAEPPVESVLDVAAAERAMEEAIRTLQRRWSLSFNAVSAADLLVAFLAARGFRLAAVPEGEPTAEVLEADPAVRQPERLDANETHLSPGYIEDQRRGIPTYEEVMEDEER